MDKYEQTKYHLYKDEDEGEDLSPHKEVKMTYGTTIDEENNDNYYEEPQSTKKAWWKSRWHQVMPYARIVIAGTKNIHFYYVPSTDNFII